MKSWAQIREAIDGKPRIVAAKQFDVFRDGGSHGHEVLNSEECGFCRIIQDFSIHSKRNGTAGGWYANRMPPNHIERVLIEYESIDWV